MKKKIIILIIVAVIILLTPLWLMLFYVAKVNIIYQYHMMDNKRIRNENREENEKVLHDYLKKEYGMVLYNTFEIKEAKFIDYESPNGIYEINTPFMKASFAVNVDSSTHMIWRDDFYEVLASDPKFQHLYSEWVKKQIGCEDPDVEFKFISVSMGERISIDFNLISDMTNNYDSIFMNVKNYFCVELCKKEITQLNKNNAYNIANNLRKDLFIKAINITGKPNCKMGGYISLSNNEFEKEALNIYYRYDIKNDNEILKLCDY